jgi:hypothetical protein
MTTETEQKEIKNKEQVERFKKQLISLLKAVVVVIAIYLLELFGNWVYNFFNTEELSLTLTPFHNNYFSFDKYYLTSASSLSGDVSATFRFVIIAFICLIFSRILRLIILFIPVVKNYFVQITASLFIAILTFSLFVSFFFPIKKSVFSLNTKEIALIEYSCYIFPSTVHIPFAEIKNITYTYYFDYDTYADKYNVYMVIMAETQSGEKKLGETVIGKQEGTKDQKPDFKASAEITALGEKTILLLNQAVQK